MGLKIVSAEFLKGAVKPSQYPLLDIPEFAFFGRSNVGKSSLINMLVNRKNLVKTGATPGKTQEVNFFLINRPNKFSMKDIQTGQGVTGKDVFCLTDLPGYGYAKLSGRSIQSIDKMLYDYCSERENLAGIFLLLDIRREPTEVEKNTVNLFNELGIYTVIIGTKADKISKNEQFKQVQILCKFFECEKDQIIITSTLKRIGRDAVLSKIQERMYLTEADN